MKEGKREKSVYTKPHYSTRRGNRRQPVNILSLSRYFVYHLNVWWWCDILVMVAGMIMISYTQRFHIPKWNKMKNLLNCSSIEPMEFRFRKFSFFSSHVSIRKKKKQNYRILLLNAINRIRKWSTFCHLCMSDVRTSIHLVYRINICSWKRMDWRFLPFRNC